MFPGGKGMQDLMKKAQKMQRDMERSQAELENTIFEASAGGGMVKVEINGKGAIQSLKIDPQAVDPEDVEMLEDLIVAALTEAQNKANEASAEIMQGLTGGIKIPGLF